MTGYEFGDVVLVPFPFTDQEVAKRRPAVVVSSAGYQAERPDLIIMAISSQMRPPLSFGEVVVQHWRASGLLKPSVVKPVLTTIESGLVLRVLGRLSLEDRRAVAKSLTSIIGFGDA